MMIPTFRRRLNECFRLNGPPPPSKLLHSRPIVGRQIGNFQVLSIRSAVGKLAAGLTRRMHVPGMYRISKKRIVPVVQDTKVGIVVLRNYTIAGLRVDLSS